MVFLMKKVKLKAGLASLGNVVELDGLAVCGMVGELPTGLGLLLFFLLLGAGISGAQK